MSNSSFENIDPGEARADESMANQPGIQQNEEVKSKLLPAKPLLYVNLEAHRFNLPSMKSQICTKKLLSEVKDGECFMFTTDMIVKHNVPYPPPVHILQKVVAE